jgi:hypothetical protein
MTDREKLKEISEKAQNQKSLVDALSQQEITRKRYLSIYSAIFRLIYVYLYKCEYAYMLMSIYVYIYTYVYICTCIQIFIQL